MLHLDDLLNTLLNNLSTLENEERATQKKLEEQEAEKGFLSKEKEQKHWRNSSQLQARREQNRRYREKQKQKLLNLSLETGFDPKLEDRRVHRIKVLTMKIGKG